MKKKIILSLIFLIVFIGAGRLAYLKTYEKYRYSYETHSFCDSLESLVLLSYIDSEYKIRLASFYASGLCVQPNLSRALELYRSVFGDDKIKIGEHIFFDTIEIVDIMNDKYNIEYVNQLIEKSKQLGYVPDKQYIDRLKFDQLKILYLAK